MNVCEAARCFEVLRCFWVHSASPHGASLFEHCARRFVKHPSLSFALCCQLSSEDIMRSVSTPTPVRNVESLAFTHCHWSHSSNPAAFLGMAKHVIQEMDTADMRPYDSIGVEAATTNAGAFAALMIAARLLYSALLFLLIRADACTIPPHFYSTRSKNPEAAAASSLSSNFIRELPSTTKNAAPGPVQIRPQFSKEATKPSTGKRNGHKLCVHNRRFSMCAECKGGSMCIHGRQRHWCRECGGKARCIHGKQRSRCVDCDGVGICVHKRLKWRCAQCKKTDIA